MADGSNISATTELQVQFVSEDADYNSVLGWYNKRTGEAGFLFASTNDDGEKAAVHAGDYATFSALQSDIDAGNIGFFLVPDGSKDVTRLGNTSIRFETDHSGNGEIVYDTQHGEKEILGTQGQILFSDRTLNVGDKDYMSGMVGTQGQTNAQKFGNQSDGDDGILGLMAWDDQVIQSGNKGTDRDFNDVVFNVSIVNTNHAPVATPILFLTHEDTPIADAVVATDEDGDKLTYALSGPAPAGLSFHSDGTFTYNPPANFFGSVTFSYTASDGTATSAPAVITIGVAPENDAPIVSGDFFGQVIEDVVDVANGTVVFTDIDPGETGTLSSPGGTTPHGTYTVDSDGNWQWKLDLLNPSVQALAEGEIITDTFNVISRDGTTAQSVNIDIKGTNDAPYQVLIDNDLVDTVPGETPGAVVGTLSTSDIDVNDTSFHYDVSDARFEVVGDILKLKDGIAIDHNLEHTITLFVTSTDPYGGSHTQQLEIQVTQPPVPVNGLAEDGYLSGALVFADANNNGFLDGQENFTFTNADGTFGLDSSDGQIVVQGGTDQATGLLFEGSLRAPAGSTVITPLTSLIAAVADFMPLEDAIALVRQALGLPDDIDPLNTDPIAAYVGGDPDALALFAAGAELVNTASLIGSMYLGAFGILQETTMPAVFSAIAAQLVDGNPIDLTSDDSIVGIMINTANILGAPFVEDHIMAESADIAAAANAFTQTMAADPNLPPHDILTQISAGSLVAQGAAGDAIMEFAITGFEPDGFFNYVFEYPSQANGVAYLISDPSGSTTYGDDGTNTPTLTEDDDTYDGKGGEDVVSGLGGNDTLSGGADNDTLDGGERDDRLDGGLGNDAIDGGNGKDTVSYVSADSERVISLLNGDAIALFGSEHDIISNVENVIGSGYIDFITGDDNDNVLEGRASNDVLHGLGGNDVLVGGAGEDQLNGEGGIDEIRHAGTAVDGYDVLYDADGTDYIVLTTPDLYDINFSRSGDDLFVSGFQLNQASSGGVQVIGHYAGSSIDYVIVDTEFYNELYSGTTDNAKLYFTTDLANGLVNQQDGGEIFVGSDGDDTINTNGGIYDAVYAGLGNDIVNGGDEREQLRGQGGDDEIRGGGGNDRLRGDEGFDTLDGGDGDDLARYDRAAAGVIVDLAAGTADDRTASGNIDHDILISIEDVRGSEFSDILLGDTGRNFIDAIGGNDTINAGAGDNTIFGGAGNDTVEDGGGNDFADGGAGDDRLQTDGVSDWLIGGDGIDIVALTTTPPTSDTLSNFADFMLGTDRIDLSEIITGFGNASDPAQYVQVANVIDDDGAHTIIQVSPDGTGAGFIDVLRLFNVTVSLDDLLNSGAFLLAPQTGTDGPDDVILTEFGDIFDGRGGNDTIAALGGDDKITGGADDDDVDLGAGSDTYSHTGNLSDGNDTIHTGDDGLDRIVFTGEDFYDINYVRDGNDLVVGPFDPDTEDFLGSVRVADHYAGFAIASVQMDFAIYNLDYGTDPDIATFYFTTDLANGIENDGGTEVLLGSDDGETINGNGGFYDSIFGFAGDDTIDGGEGLDNIRGGEGNDIVYGSGGNDSIRGDQGDDILDGGDGTDRIRYDRGVVTGGVWVDIDGGFAMDLDGIDDQVGFDTLINFENIAGSAFDDKLQGTIGDNLIMGRGGDDWIFGNVGHDSLIGEDGNDTILGGGSFTSGGAGDDLIVDTGGTTIEGDDGDDVITFNWYASASSFATGGAGRDVFLFQTHDVEQFNYIGDLELGPTGDILDVSNLGFIDPNAIDQYLQVGDFYNDLFLFFDPSGTGTGFTPVAYLNNMAGVTLEQLIDDGNLVFGPTASGVGDATGAVYDGDDQGAIFYALGGSDTVNGGGGNDLFRGGAGDDLLSGAAGNDRLEGGADSDTFVLAFSNAGDDVIGDFDRTTDRLSFTDVVDGDFNGLDLDDLLAMVSAVVDDGFDVLVTYTTGASTQFQGAGNGGIASLTDLVDDPASQIQIA